MGFEENWDNFSLDLIPVEYKVIVLPDKVKEKSDGGIEFAPKAIETEQWAQTRGVLIAIGGMAFSDWKGKVPKIGDKVYYGKYAGLETDLLGDNEMNFRAMNDKDIVCVVRKK